MEDLLELEEKFEQYARLCKCGMRTVLARIENLQEELEASSERNIYDTIETRIKCFDSVIEKCERRGYPKTIEGIKDNIRDIAGIRIVTLFQDDIYKIRDALMKQPSMIVLEQRDYVAEPKENGYRSYHLIVAMHIYFRERSVAVPVEIQIRTKAMDLWASVEHYCRYKRANSSDIGTEMFDNIATILSNFDEHAIKLREANVALSAEATP